MAATRGPTNPDKETMKQNLQIAFLMRLRKILEDKNLIDDAVQERKGLYQDGNPVPLSKTQDVFDYKGEKHPDSFRQGKITVDNRIEDTSRQPDYLKNLSLRERIIFTSAVFKAHADVVDEMNHMIAEKNRELSEKIPPSGIRTPELEQEERKLDEEGQITRELIKDFGQDQLCNQLRGAGIEGSKATGYKSNPALIDSIEDKTLSIAATSATKELISETSDFLKNTSNEEKAKFLQKLNAEFSAITSQPDRTKTSLFGTAHSYTPEQEEKMRKLKANFLTVLKSILPPESRPDLSKASIVSSKNGGDTIKSEVKDLLKLRAKLHASPEHGKR